MTLAHRLSLIVASCLLLVGCSSSPDPTAVEVKLQGTTLAKGVEQKLDDFLQNQYSSSKAKEACEILTPQTRRTYLATMAEDVPAEVPTLEECAAFLEAITESYGYTKADVKEVAFSRAEKKGEIYTFQVLTIHQPQGKAKGETLYDFWDGTYDASLDKITLAYPKGLHPDLDTYAVFY